MENKMNVDFEEIIKIAEDLDFGVSDDGDNRYCFGKYSSAGQDFSFSLDIKEDMKSFASEVWEYYESYDVSEEASYWIDSSGHGANGAPYEAIEVIADMEECKGFIKEFYKALMGIKTLNILSYDLDVEEFVSFSIDMTTLKKMIIEQINLDTDIVFNDEDISVGIESYETDGRSVCVRIVLKDDEITESLCDKYACEYQDEAILTDAILSTMFKRTSSFEMSDDDDSLKITMSKENYEELID